MTTPNRVYRIAPRRVTAKDPTIEAIAQASIASAQHRRKLKAMLQTSWWTAHAAPGASRAEFMAEVIRRDRERQNQVHAVFTNANAETDA